MVVSISIKQNQTLKETLSNIKQIREELTAIDISEKMKKEVFDKLNEIQKMALDVAVVSIDQKEGASEELKRIRNLSDDLRTTTWKKLAIHKQAEVKAELFSLWYGDRDLEKEFRNIQEMIASDPSEKNAEDTVKDYKTAIEKLSSIAEDLSGIKQKSSLRNMGKFLVWAVPFVFTLAQSLAVNQPVVFGYLVPWYLPIAGLVVGSCAVWGWIRSKYSARRNLGFFLSAFFIAVLITFALVFIVGWAANALGFSWDIRTGMITTVILYALSGAFYLIGNRKHLRKAFGKS